MFKLNTCYKVTDIQFLSEKCSSFKIYFPFFIMISSRPKGV